MRLKMLVLLWSILLTGCVSPTDKTLPEPLPEPDKRIVIKDDTTSNVSVSVGVTETVWDFLATKVKSNTLVIKDAISIKDGKDSVNIPAGTSATLVISDKTAEVTFSEPYPEGSKYGIFHTKIKSLTLFPTGSGLAKTGIGNVKFTWLRPDDPTGIAGASTSGRFILVSQESCPPCKALISTLPQTTLDKLQIINYDKLTNSSVARLAEQTGTPVLVELTAEGSIKRYMVQMSDGSMMDASGVLWFVSE